MKTAEVLRAICAEEVDHTIRGLARRTGASESAVRQAVRVLEQRGLVRVIVQGGRHLIDPTYHGLQAQGIKA